MKTDRTVITQNLCVCLIVSYVLILTTLDKHYFDLDDVSCVMKRVHKYNNTNCIMKLGHR